MIANTLNFNFSIAQAADSAALEKLISTSIVELQKPFLSRAQIQACFEVMGIDAQLIEDQTYFKATYGELIVGCGGWSRRQTLYGGHHAPTDHPERLDPTSDAAIIRAMYTHPHWARKGIGKRIIALSETAARREGFHQCELIATLAGEPLYQSCGYQVAEVAYWQGSNGIGFTIKRMVKDLI